MRKLLFCLFLVLGCSKDQGDKVKEVVKNQLKATAPVAIATVLECKRLDLVKEDVGKKIDDIFSSEARESNDLAKVLCKAAVKTLANTLLEEGVPKRWECKLESAGLVVDVIADASCEGL